MEDIFIEIDHPEQKLSDGFKMGVNFVQLIEWLQEENNRTKLDDILRQRKAVIFRGFGLSNANDMEAIIEATMYKNMEYLGGAAVRTQVTSRIFTANESPPSEPIPFHHEMSQVPNPPTHLFFYCEKPALNGGSTPILVSNDVYSRLANSQPDFINAIEGCGVRYVRIIPEEDDPTSAIGRGWRSTLLVPKDELHPKEWVENKLQSMNMIWEWMNLNDEHSDLKTITSCLPAIRIDEGPKRSGKKTFFNSVVAAVTGWNDKRNDGKKAVLIGNEGSVYCEISAIESAVDIMNSLAVSIPWCEHDFILIDNRTVMHSRQPFEGPRRVLASIVYDPLR